MNRQPVPGQPIRNLANLSSQNAQPRTQTSGSRLVASKGPGAWGSNQTGTQPLPQPHDSSNSWAQAMNPRGTNQLDLSSSSFPSLAGGDSASNNARGPSSQWQAGPPARDLSSQQQNTRVQQRQQQLPAQSSAFGDTFSRSEFSSIDSSARFPTRSTHNRAAPPGLVPSDGAQQEAASLAQSRKSPTSQNVNGSIGQERANGTIPNQTSPDSSTPKDAFSSSEALSPNGAPEETSEATLKALSEKDKWGMAGWQALYGGPEAEFRAVTRAQDLQTFQLQLRDGNNDGNHLLRRYTGPFAPPTAFQPRPLDTDYHIPECYIVHNVAPITQRISGFTEDTLFYIFYTSPKDIIQEEVATELMSRKWRFHMKEKMWLTRDDSVQAPMIIQKDVCEQGYYIWWDYRNWKKVRKPYELRYEDLDDHLSGGRSLQMPGLFSGGFGAMGNMNGTGDGGATGRLADGFNAVPGLERLAAMGRGF